MEEIGARISLTVKCKNCRNSTEIPNISLDGYIRWGEGELIQRALPELNIVQRELMISGICGTCWDNMFKPGADFILEWTPKLRGILKEDEK